MPEPPAGPEMDEAVAKLLAINPAAGDAMEALFDFSEAMDKDVMVQDLSEMMKVAVKDGEGFPMLKIALSMALMAAEIAQSRA